MPELAPHLHCPSCGIALAVPEPDALTLTLCPRGHVILCPVTERQSHRCERCATGFAVLGADERMPYAGTRPAPEPAAPAIAQRVTPTRPERMERGGVPL